MSEDGKKSYVIDFLKLTKGNKHDYNDDQSEDNIHVKGEIENYTNPFEGKEDEEDEHYDRENDKEQEHANEEDEDVEHERENEEGESYRNEDEVEEVEEREDCERDDVKSQREEDHPTSNIKDHKFYEHKDDTYECYERGEGNIESDNNESGENKAHGRDLGVRGYQAKPSQTFNPKKNSRLDEEEDEQEINPRRNEDNKYSYLEKKFGKQKLKYEDDDSEEEDDDLDKKFLKYKIDYNKLLGKATEEKTEQKKDDRKDVDKEQTVANRVKPQIRNESDEEDEREELFNRYKYLTDFKKSKETEKEASKKVDEMSKIEPKDTKITAQNDDRRELEVKENRGNLRNKEIEGKNHTGAELQTHGNLHEDYNLKDYSEEDCKEKDSDNEENQHDEFQSMRTKESSLKNTVLTSNMNYNIKKREFEENFTEDEKKIKHHSNNEQKQSKGLNLHTYLTRDEGNDEGERENYKLNRSLSDENAAENEEEIEEIKGNNLVVNRNQDNDDEEEVEEGEFDESQANEHEPEETSVSFTNCFIQKSFNRANSLHKNLLSIILKKHQKDQTSYLLNWLEKANKIGLKQLEESKKTSKAISSLLTNSYLQSNLKDDQNYKTHFEKQAGHSSTNSYLSDKQRNIETELDKEKGKDQQITKSITSNFRERIVREKEKDLSLQKIKSQPSNEEKTSKETPTVSLNHKKVSAQIIFLVMSLRNNLNYQIFFSNLQLYDSFNKIKRNNLNLLQLFIQLNIHKMKNNKYSSTFKKQATELKAKAMDFEAKIKKLEKNLTEKMEIIEKKNDIIENRNDTIEGLNIQVDNLKAQVSKLEAKRNNLNIIQESLCHKCANSLEESIIISQTPKARQGHGGNQSIFFDPEYIPENVDGQLKVLQEEFRKKEDEYKATIQEQYNIIVKMEQDSKELKIKNYESKIKSDNTARQLEEIKKEFSALSENVLNKKSSTVNPGLVPKETRDTYSQTEHFSSANLNSSVISNTSASSSVNSVNEKNQSQASILNNTTKVNSTGTKTGVTGVKKSSTIKPNNKKFATKLNLTKKEETSKSSTNITNVNSSQLDSERMYDQGETLRNLQHENSLILQNLSILSKENMKFKGEVKLLTESFKKVEKERDELKKIYQKKSENFDKVRKENEEIKILIQGANFKGIMTLEAENKKLNSDILLLRDEIEELKQEMSKKAQKTKETEQELMQNKKQMDQVQKMKVEKETLILDNTKLSSELKRMKMDLDTVKLDIEKQVIIIKNQNEVIMKKNDDLNYLSFAIKKAEQDAKKAINDAMAFEQIVRKMESKLAESEIKREKIEQDFKSFKLQFNK